MMDYLLYPNNMLKTIQKAELNLKHCKISESKNQLENLFAAYCLFLNVNFEALGVSKILFNFLSVVFEYCGMLKNPKNLEKNSKIFEKNEKITNSEKKINKLNNFEKKEIKLMNSEKKENKSLLLAKSTLEFICGSTKNKKNYGYEENLQTKTCESDDEKFFKQNNYNKDDILNHEPVRPPRISQKYLDAKYEKNRSNSVVSLKFVQSRV